MSTAKKGPVTTSSNGFRREGDGSSHFSRPAPPPPTAPPESRLPLIIVVIVVVFVLTSVASAFVLPSMERGLSGGHVGSSPIGSAFAAGNAVRSVCPSGSTFSANGCAATHFRYIITIKVSLVTLGDVWFGVNAANGSTAFEFGGLGFTILNASQVVLAQLAVTGGFLSMESSPWTYPSGISASTPLITTDTIVIDFGTLSPHGQPLTFLAYGASGYSGTTAPTTLFY